MAETEKMDKETSQALENNVTLNTVKNCTLCGCSTPAVKCDRCGSQAFCLSCDDMYHRHPKRRFHLRKAVDSIWNSHRSPRLRRRTELPGDPSKIPIPPPRTKKRHFMSGISSMFKPSLEMSGCKPFWLQKKGGQSQSTGAGLKSVSPVSPEPSYQNAKGTNDLDRGSKPKKLEDSQTQTLLRRSSADNPNVSLNSSLPIHVFVPGTCVQGDPQGRNLGYPQHVPSQGMQHSMSAADLTAAVSAQAVPPVYPFPPHMHQFYHPHVSPFSPSLAPFNCPHCISASWSNLMSPNMMQFHQHHHIPPNTIGQYPGTMKGQRSPSPDVFSRQATYQGSGTLFPSTAFSHPTSSLPVNAHLTPDAGFTSLIRDTTVPPPPSPTSSFTADVPRNEDGPITGLKQTIQMSDEEMVSDEEEQGEADHQGEDAEPIIPEIPIEPWTCLHCTYVNPPGSHICEVCCKTSYSSVSVVKKAPKHKKAKSKGDADSMTEHKNDSIESNGKISHDMIAEYSIPSTVSNRQKVITGSPSKIVAEIPYKDSTECKDESFEKKDNTKIATGKSETVELYTTETQTIVHTTSTDVQTQKVGCMSASSSTNGLISMLRQEMSIQTEYDAPVDRRTIATDPMISSQSLESLMSGMSAPPYHNRRAGMNAGASFSTQSLSAFERGRSRSPMPRSASMYGEMRSFGRGLNYFSQDTVGQNWNNAWLASDPMYYKPHASGVSPSRDSYFDGHWGSMDRLNKKAAKDEEKWKHAAKPRHYKSLEDLKTERIPIEGLSVMQCLQTVKDAERCGFSVEDLQVAYVNCHKTDPLIWLQENWESLVHSVIMLAAKCAEDNEEHDVGPISAFEAKTALRNHQGNIWDAVAECIEMRQRKILELTVRGNFTQKQIVEALKNNNGNVELAYADLIRTSSKLFKHILSPGLSEESEDISVHIPLPGAPTEMENIKKPENKISEKDIDESSNKKKRSDFLTKLACIREAQSERRKAREEKELCREVEVPQEHDVTDMERDVVSPNKTLDDISEHLSSDVLKAGLHESMEVSTNLDLSQFEILSSEVVTETCPDFQERVNVDSEKKDEELPEDYDSHWVDSQGEWIEEYSDEQWDDECEGEWVTVRTKYKKLQPDFDAEAMEMAALWEKEELTDDVFDDEPNVEANILYKDSKIMKQLSEKEKSEWSGIDIKAKELALSNVDDSGLNLPQESDAIIDNDFDLDANDNWIVKDAERLLHSPESDILLNEESGQFEDEHFIPVNESEAMVNISVPELRETSEFQDRIKEARSGSLDEGIEEGWEKLEKHVALETLQREETHAENEVQSMKSSSATKVNVDNLQNAASFDSEVLTQVLPLPPKRRQSRPLLPGIDLPVDENEVVYKENFIELTATPSSVAKEPIPPARRKSKLSETEIAQALAEALATEALSATEIPPALPLKIREKLSEAPLKDLQTTLDERETAEHQELSEKNVVFEPGKHEAEEVALQNFNEGFKMELPSKETSPVTSLSFESDSNFFADSESEVDVGKIKFKKHYRSDKRESFTVPVIDSEEQEEEEEELQMRKGEILKTEIKDSSKAFFEREKIMLEGYENTMFSKQEIKRLHDGTHLQESPNEKSLCDTESQDAQFVNDPLTPKAFRESVGRPLQLFKEPKPTAISEVVSLMDAGQTNTRNFDPCIQHEQLEMKTVTEDVIMDKDTSQTVSSRVQQSDIIQGFFQEQKNEFKAEPSIIEISASHQPQGMEIVSDSQRTLLHDQGSMQYKNEHVEVQSTVAELQEVALPTEESGLSKIAEEEEIIPLSEMETRSAVADYYFGRYNEVTVVRKPKKKPLIVLSSKYPAKCIMSVSMSAVTEEKSGGFSVQNKEDEQLSASQMSTAPSLEKTAPLPLHVQETEVQNVSLSSPEDTEAIPLQVQMKESQDVSLHSSQITPLQTGIAEIQGVSSFLEVSEKLTVVATAAECIEKPGFDVVPMDTDVSVINNNYMETEAQVAAIVSKDINLVSAKDTQACAALPSATTDDKQATPSEYVSFADDYFFGSYNQVTVQKKPKKKGPISASKLREPVKRSISSELTQSAMEIPYDTMASTDFTEQSELLSPSVKSKVSISHHPAGTLSDSKSPVFSLSENQAEKLEILEKECEDTSVSKSVRFEDACESFPIAPPPRAKKLKKEHVNSQPGDPSGMQNNSQGPPQHVFDEYLFGSYNEATSQRKIGVSASKKKLPFYIEDLGENPSCVLFDNPTHTCIELLSETEAESLLSSKTACCDESSFLDAEEFVDAEESLETYAYKSDNFVSFQDTQVLAPKLNSGTSVQGSSQILNTEIEPITTHSLMPVASCETTSCQPENASSIITVLTGEVSQDHTFEKALECLQPKAVELPESVHLSSFSSLQNQSENVKVLDSKILKYGDDDNKVEKYANSQNGEEPTIVKIVGLSPDPVLLRSCHSEHLVADIVESTSDVSVRKDDICDEKEASVHVPDKDTHILSLECTKFQVSDFNLQENVPFTEGFLSENSLNITCLSPDLMLQTTEMDESCVTTLSMYDVACDYAETDLDALEIIPTDNINQPELPKEQLKDYKGMDFTDGGTWDEMSNVPYLSAVNRFYEECIDNARPIVAQCIDITAGHVSHVPVTCKHSGGSLPSSECSSTDSFESLHDVESEGIWLPYSQNSRISNNFSEHNIVHMAADEIFVNPSAVSYNFGEANVHSNAAQKCVSIAARTEKQDNVVSFSKIVHSSKSVIDTSCQTELEFFEDQFYDSFDGNLPGAYPIEYNDSIPIKMEIGIQCQLPQTAVSNDICDLTSEQVYGTKKSTNQELDEDLSFDSYAECENNLLLKADDSSSKENSSFEAMEDSDSDVYIEFRSSKVESDLSLLQKSNVVRRSKQYGLDSGMGSGSDSGENILDLKTVDHSLRKLPRSLSSVTNFCEVEPNVDTGSFFKLQEEIDSGLQRENLEKHDVNVTDVKTSSHLSNKGEDFVIESKDFQDRIQKDIGTVCKLESDYQGQIIMYDDKIGNFKSSIVHQKESSTTLASTEHNRSEEGEIIPALSAVGESANIETYKQSEKTQALTVTPDTLINTTEFSKIEHVPALCVEISDTSIRTMEVDAIEQNENLSNFQVQTSVAIANGEECKPGQKALVHLVQSQNETTEVVKGKQVECVLNSRVKEWDKNARAAGVVCTQVENAPIFPLEMHQTDTGVTEVKTYKQNEQVSESHIHSESKNIETAEGEACRQVDYVINSGEVLDTSIKEVQVETCKQAEFAPFFPEKFVEASMGTPELKMPKQPEPASSVTTTDKIFVEFEKAVVHEQVNEMFQSGMYERIDLNSPVKTASTTDHETGSVQATDGLSKCSASIDTHTSIAKIGISTKSKHVSATASDPSKVESNQSGSKIGINTQAEHVLVTTFDPNNIESIQSGSKIEVSKQSEHVSVTTLDSSKVESKQSCSISSLPFIDSRRDSTPVAECIGPAASIPQIPTVTEVKFVELETEPSHDEQETMADGESEKQPSSPTVEFFYGPLPFEVWQELQQYEASHRGLGQSQSDDLWEDVPSSLESFISSCTTEQYVDAQSTLPSDTSKYFTGTSSAMSTASEFELCTDNSLTAFSLDSDECSTASDLLSDFDAIKEFSPERDTEIMIDSVEEDGNLVIINKKNGHKPVSEKLEDSDGCNLLSSTEIDGHKTISEKLEDSDGYNLLLSTEKISKSPELYKTDCPSIAKDESYHKETEIHVEAMAVPQVNVKLQTEVLPDSEEMVSEILDMSYNSVSDELERCSSHSSDLCIDEFVSLHEEAVHLTEGKDLESKTAVDEPSEIVRYLFYKDCPSFNDHREFIPETSNTVGNIGDLSTESNTEVFLEKQMPENASVNETESTQNILSKKENIFSNVASKPSTLTTVETPASTSYSCLNIMTLQELCKRSFDSNSLFEEFSSETKLPLNSALETGISSAAVFKYSATTENALVECDSNVTSRNALNTLLAEAQTTMEVLSENPLESRATKFPVEIVEAAPLVSSPETLKEPQVGASRNISSKDLKTFDKTALESHVKSAKSEALTNTTSVQTAEDSMPMKDNGLVGSFKETSGVVVSSETDVLTPELEKFLEDKSPAVDSAMKAETISNPESSTWAKINSTEGISQKLDFESGQHISGTLTFVGTALDTFNASECLIGAFTKPNQPTSTDAGSPLISVDVKEEKFSLSKEVPSKLIEAHPEILCMNSSVEKNQVCDLNSELAQLSEMDISASVATDVMTEILNPTSSSTFVDEEFNDVSSKLISTDISDNWHDVESDYSLAGVEQDYIADSFSEKIITSAKEGKPFLDENTDLNIATAPTSFSRETKVSEVEDLKPQEPKAEHLEKPNANTNEDSVSSSNRVLLESNSVSDIELTEFPGVATDISTPLPLEEKGKGAPEKIYDAVLEAAFTPDCHLKDASSFARAGQDLEMILPKPKDVLANSDFINLSDPELIADSQEIHLSSQDSHLVVSEMNDDFTDSHFHSLSENLSKFSDNDEKSDSLNFENGNMTDTSVFKHTDTISEAEMKDEQVLQQYGLGSTSDQNSSSQQQKMEVINEIYGSTKHALYDNELRTDESVDFRFRDVISSADASVTIAERKSSHTEICEKFSDKAENENLTEKVLVNFEFKDSIPLADASTAVPEGATQFNVQKQETCHDKTETAVENVVDFKFTDSFPPAEPSVAIVEREALSYSEINKTTGNRLANLENLVDFKFTETIPSADATVTVPESTASSSNTKIGETSYGKSAEFGNIMDFKFTDAKSAVDTSAMVSKRAALFNTEGGEVFCHKYTEFENKQSAEKFLVDFKFTDTITPSEVTVTESQGSNTEVGKKFCDKSAELENVVDFRFTDMISTVGTSAVMVSEKEAVANSEIGKMPCNKSVGLGKEETTEENLVDFKFVDVIPTVDTSRIFPDKTSNVRSSEGVHFEGNEFSSKPSVATVDNDTMDYVEKINSECSKAVDPSNIIINPILAKQCEVSLLREEVGVFQSTTCEPNRACVYDIPDDIGMEQKLPSSLTRYSFEDFTKSSSDRADTVADFSELSEMFDFPTDSSEMNKMVTISKPTDFSKSEELSLSSDNFCDVMTHVHTCEDTSLSPAVISSQDTSLSPAVISSHVAEKQGIPDVAVDSSELSEFSDLATDYKEGQNLITANDLSESEFCFKTQSLPKGSDKLSEHIACLPHEPTNKDTWAGAVLTAASGEGHAKGIQQDYSFDKDVDQTSKIHVSQQTTDAKLCASDETAVAVALPYKQVQLGEAFEECGVSSVSSQEIFFEAGVVSGIECHTVLDTAVENISREISAKEQESVGADTTADVSELSEIADFPIDINQAPVMLPVKFPETDVLIPSDILNVSSADREISEVTSEWSDVGSNKFSEESDYVSITGKDINEKKVLPSKSGDLVLKIAGIQITDKIGEELGNPPLMKLELATKDNENVALAASLQTVSKKEELHEVSEPHVLSTIKSKMTAIAVNILEGEKVISCDQVVSDVSSLQSTEYHSLQTKHTEEAVKDGFVDASPNTLSDSAESCLHSESKALHEDFADTPPTETQYLTDSSEQKFTESKQVTGASDILSGNSTSYFTDDSSGLQHDATSDTNAILESVAISSNERSCNRDVLKSANVAKLGGIKTEHLMEEQTIEAVLYKKETLDNIPVKKDIVAMQLKSPESQKVVVWTKAISEADVNNVTPVSASDIVVLDNSVSLVGEPQTPCLPFETVQKEPLSTESDSVSELSYPKSSEYFDISHSISDLSNSVNVDSFHSVFSFDSKVGNVAQSDLDHADECATVELTNILDGVIDGLDLDNTESFKAASAVPVQQEYMSEKDGGSMYESWSDQSFELEDNALQYEQCMDEDYTEEHLIYDIQDFDEEEEEILKAIDLNLEKFDASHGEIMGSTEVCDYEQLESDVLLEDDMYDHHIDLEISEQSMYEFAANSSANVDSFVSIYEEDEGFENLPSLNERLDGTEEYNYENEKLNAVEGQLLEDLSVSASIRSIKEKTEAVLIEGIAISSEMLVLKQITDAEGASTEIQRAKQGITSFTEEKSAENEHKSPYTLKAVSLSETSVHNAILSSSEIQDTSEGVFISHTKVEEKVEAVLNGTITAIDKLEKIQKAADVKIVTTEVNKKKLEVTTSIEESLQILPESNVENAQEASGVCKSVSLPEICVVDEISNNSLEEKGESKNVTALSSKVQLTLIQEVESKVMSCENKNSIKDSIKSSVVKDQQNEKLAVINQPVMEELKSPVQPLIEEPKSEEVQLPMKKLKPEAQPLVEEAKSEEVQSPIKKPKSEAQPLVEEPKSEVQPPMKKPKSEAQPLVEEPKSEVQPPMKKPKSEAQPLVEEDKSEEVQSPMKKPNSEAQPLVERPKSEVQPPMKKSEAQPLVEEPKSQAVQPPMKKSEAQPLVETPQSEEVQHPMKKSEAQHFLEEPKSEEVQPLMKKSEAQPLVEVPKLEEVQPPMKKSKSETKPLTEEPKLEDVKAPELPPKKPIVAGQSFQESLKAVEEQTSLPQKTPKPQQSITDDQPLLAVHATQEKLPDNECKAVDVEKLPDIPVKKCRSRSSLTSETDAISSQTINDSVSPKIARDSDASLPEPQFIRDVSRSDTADVNKIQQNNEEKIYTPKEGPFSTTPSDHNKQSVSDKKVSSEDSTTENKKDQQKSLRKRSTQLNSEEINDVKVTDKIKRSDSTPSGKNEEQVPIPRRRRSRTVEQASDLPDDSQKSMTSSENGGDESLLHRRRSTSNEEQAPALPRKRLSIEDRMAKLQAEGKCSNKDKAFIAAKLIEMQFEESDALNASKQCNNVYHAVKFLTQLCEMCNCRFPINMMSSMVHCPHKACKECLKAHFTTLIYDRSIFYLLCPICHKPDISDHNIQDYFNHLDMMLRNILEREVYDLFQRKLRDEVLTKDPNFHWCSQCCSGFIASPRLKKLYCPDCSAVTCALCHQTWELEHEGVHCERFQQWKDMHTPEPPPAGLVKALAERGVTCPSCGIHYPHASGGCMVYKCAHCSFEFCAFCLKAYSKGKDCQKLPVCADLGSHTHHSYNCLVFLRDKPWSDLQQLLSDMKVPYPTIPPPDQIVKSRCQVREQKHVHGAVTEDRCGRDIEPYLAGICRVHYKEYLAELLRKHKGNPLTSMTTQELQFILRKSRVFIPEKIKDETLDEYRSRIVKEVYTHLPL